ncbi:MAG: sigma-54-dependent Fis family transcriptional regulator [Desulfobulbaceae bacterium]|nr:sigma-54-dependent Fis family transcriptional regulator [Desulfobulbaceae bacterium]
MLSDKKQRVLLVDDDAAIREILSAILSRHNYDVDQAENGRDGLRMAENRVYDHIITDIAMPVMGGLTFLEQLRDKEIHAATTVISAHTDMENVRRAFKLGASDFIAKPFQSDDAVLLTLKKVEEKARLAKENRLLRREVGDSYKFANIVSKSGKMQAIFNIISKIADYKTTILVSGESGTGKELIAKAIHYNSVRKNKPLIDVNCGGIPDTLLESELFGHVKGAFTDAYRAKKGLFEEADGGTLFLDEMGELPLALQVKMLRALQEEEIRPLGESKSVKVDVRIIAATSKNLREEVNKKNFREDLFYRINVLNIEVPPLRDRREDIPLLVSHFIEKYNKRLGLDIEKVNSEYLQCMMDYSWPGNVRELENVIERSMALSEQKILELELLPPELLRDTGRPVDRPNNELFFQDEISIKKNSKKLEKILITKALTQTKGNKTRAALLLEISLPALLYKIKEYQVN